MSGGGEECEQGGHAGGSEREDEEEMLEGEKGRLAGWVEAGLRVGNCRHRLRQVQVILWRLWLEAFERRVWSRRG